jgi:hypothetical protein
MSTTAADKTPIGASGEDRPALAAAERFIAERPSSPIHLVSADGATVALPDPALRVLRAALRLLEGGQAVAVLPAREAYPSGASGEPGPHEREQIPPVEDDEIALIRALAGRSRPLTLRERIRRRRQARKLDQLLDEMDRESGPVPEETLERVRRAWPAD